jgi:hypothetical protein
MGDKEFYLGRIFDPAQGKVTADPLMYDPADLTTHGVVMGMTGSGKTGLCVGLLEEAALQGVPAIIVDPKGDLTNLLLHFPKLQSQDFEPWVDPDAARRAGKTSPQLAQETAAMWTKGIADWGMTPERIAALGDAVNFTVYTPGSDAGKPVSILASLKVPQVAWEGNREILRERISSTVTALLGLIGLTDLDPVRSREHILLSNIFENAWSQGKDLDLSELIMQTQTPPFDKLGVFPVDNFFPPKDRFELAMLLNNFLAAPAFQSWMEGEPLDAANMLYSADGKPRHSIFYIAHLPETERMFFVTLLFSAVETWMRTQTGTSGLRALVYFDEIMGYLPPLGNPPSKTIMLRMLKQARAFGVGMLLATQNPVDVDYKGLSNAGTWMIGKLQTDQDKQRLLDGLESAVGGMDRATIDKLISSLGKRVFLVNNVHEKQPQLMQTRWTLNYLAGPLTRAQIPALNALVEPQTAAPVAAPTLAPAAANANVKAAAPAAQPAEPEVAGFEKGSETRPALPVGVAEYFMPNDVTLSQALQTAQVSVDAAAKQEGIIYRPALLAQAQVRYLNRKYNLDNETTQATLLLEADPRGRVRWEEHPFAGVDSRQLSQPPAPQARFASLVSPLSDGKTMAAMQKDFEDWVYRTSTVKVRANETLKVYAGPEVSTAAFRDLCSEAAREARDAEITKATAAVEKQITTLKEKMRREERELEQNESELSQRRLEEAGKLGETLLGVLGGRKRSISSNLTKRRLTSQAKADVEESKDAIADFDKQLAELEKKKTDLAAEVNDRWAKVVDDVAEIPITPMKKDIFTDAFGVVWLPYYRLVSAGRVVEVPGFKQA